METMNSCVAIQGASARDPNSPDPKLLEKLLERTQNGPPPKFLEINSKMTKKCIFEEFLVWFFLSFLQVVLAVGHLG